MDGDMGNDPHNGDMDHGDTGQDHGDGGDGDMGHGDTGHGDMDHDHGDGGMDDHMGGDHNPGDGNAGDGHDTPIDAPWLVVENFSNAFDFNRHRNARKEEFKIYNVDEDLRRYDIGQSKDIDLYGDGSTSFFDEFGMKLDFMSDVAKLFAFVEDHSGDGDVALVDGGQVGDKHFTVAITSGETDYLRIEGDAVAALFVDDFIL